MHDTYETGTLQNKIIHIIKGIKTGLGTETKARSCFDLFLTDVTRSGCNPEHSQALLTLVLKLPDDVHSQPRADAVAVNTTNFLMAMETMGSKSNRCSHTPRDPLEKEKP